MPLAVAVAIWAFLAHFVPVEPSHYHQFHLGWPLTSTIQERSQFVSADECDALRAAAQAKNQFFPVNTSWDLASHAWLARQEDPIVRTLSTRLASWTGLPAEHQEGFNVVHFGTGGFDGPRWDGCIADDDFCENMDGPSGPRLSTVVLYLNDDYTGGATRFPYKRYSVTPEKGKALWFTNVDSHSHKVYFDSMFGNTPVLSGEKWIAVVRIRSRVVN